MTADEDRHGMAGMVLDIMTISHSLHIIKELRILKEKREVVEMLLQK